MGLNARPKPSPLRLTLKQRRALSIREYYSARMAREAIVPGQAYWFAFWLEWSQNVRAYVELPSNPDDPEAKLADFWVQTTDDEFLLDVEFGERPKDIRPASDPWALKEDGFQPASEGANSRITPRWLWARRSLLHELEGLHPFAVAARLQGGLKAQCARLLSGFSAEGESLDGLCRRVDAPPYVTQCAVMHLLRTGKVKVDWGQGLSMRSRFEKVSHAPQG